MTSVIQVTKVTLVTRQATRYINFKDDILKSFGESRSEKENKELFCGLPTLIEVGLPCVFAVIALRMNMEDFLSS